MINIPLGKALIAVEVDGNMDGMRRCKLCELPSVGQCVSVGCGPSDRRDGKNVIFKLVDYPSSELRIDGMLAGSKVTSGE